MILTLKDFQSVGGKILHENNENKYWRGGESGQYDAFVNTGKAELNGKQYDVEIRYHTNGSITIYGINDGEHRFECDVENEWQNLL